MEELKYIIEDKTIAEILGVQNFSTKESAILELVKNAYDAGASKLEIIFDTNNTLIINDNGCGMTYEDIKNNWMHVGFSSKEYSFKDVGNNSRISAGSKGIGRFALSRLGTEVYVYSKADNSSGICWFTDWNKNSLDGSNYLDTHGTYIVLYKLRDRWTSKSIDNLKKYLSRTYNSQLMEITIRFEDSSFSIQKYFSEAKLGINCLAYFDLQYDAERMTLSCTIHSDEFADKAKEFCKNKSVQYYEKSISILETLNVKNIEIDEDELSIYLKNLGDFSARMFFSLRDASANDIEKFLYKYKMLPERFDEGVILYRNAFSISSYEGKKDWLEFGKRSRKSPAAASHPTGAWRVRENQISGYVNIDKKENEFLRDLSNRQGLEENIYYQIFVVILQLGVAEFEGFRQSIIRNIDKKNVTPTVTSTPYIDRVVKSPQSVLKLDVQEAKNLAKEIVEFKKARDEDFKNSRNVEAKYKYDVRILNVLSTIGLRAASIAHEMQNDRNNISVSCDNIIAAMKEYNIWDIADSAQNKRYAYKNIPDLLQKNKVANLKIVSFMDTMLSDIEKEQFEIKEIDVTKVLNKIKETWERDYSWVQIAIPFESTYFVTAEDIIKVLIDNLILNSIQQNDSINELRISININKYNEKLLISYNDNGCGLAKKYRNNPRKILEVHESSRQNGHGLGMWILNNTLIMSGGYVVDIPLNDGFEIHMMLGDKL